MSHNPDRRPEMRLRTRLSVSSPDPLPKAWGIKEGGPLKRTVNGYNATGYYPLVHVDSNVVKSIYEDRRLVSFRVRASRPAACVFKRF
jgi:hypothetical protein